MKPYELMCLCLILLPLIINNSGSIIGVAKAQGNISLSNQAQSLLAFKSGISADPLNILSNWDLNQQPNPCLWNGIQCSKANPTTIVSISLPRASLEGKLAEQLGALGQLRHLNLHHNRLSGPIPAAIFRATQLQSLFLFSNNLSGSLPQQIAQLSGLEAMDISRNSLSGSIPGEAIAACTRLAFISLSQNQFSGEIPPEIGDLQASLKHLDLSFNNLSGNIPDTLGNLHALVNILNLSHNNLTGPIPASFAQLPSNFTLDVSYNNLSGPIPRTGAMANQTFSAFVNNTGLCGPPLPYPCPSFTPTVSMSTKKTKSLSPLTIAAIAVGDALGVILICICLFFLFYFRYCRNSASSSSSKDMVLSSSCKGTNSSTSPSPNTFEHPAKSKPATPSMQARRRSSDLHSVKGFDQLQHGELVAMENEALLFSLDDLLKASAYVLGKSSVGIVYKVSISGEQTVAVRRLGDRGSHRFKEFRAEVEAIGRIRHPNIVKLRAYYWAADEKLLVYDFLSNGSLAAAMRKVCKGEGAPLEWPARLKIAKGIARALEYLHDQPRVSISPSSEGASSPAATSLKINCAHGDIKPSNILLDSEMEPYLADYGLGKLLAIVGSGVPNLENGAKMSASSRSTSSGSSATSRCSGSGGAGAFYTMDAEDLHYKAPEELTTAFTTSSKGRISRVEPTQKADVYSFGMVLLELITGKGGGNKGGGQGGTSGGSWELVHDDVDRPRLQFVPESVVMSARGSGSGANAAAAARIPVTQLPDLLLRILDPALIPVDSEEEDSRSISSDFAEQMLGLFRIAQACVAPQPHLRPSMKDVSRCLHEI